MGLIQDWGTKASNEGKKVWKSGKHFVDQTWGDTGDFIDRKIPEFRLDVDAKIDAKVQIDKDNFNVRMDSKDIADAGAAIGTGIGSGLGAIGQSIGNSLQSFGESLGQGLEQLGEALGTSVQQGLSELGDGIVGAATQLTAGITSHGSSIENGIVEFGKISTGVAIEASRNFQNGLALLGNSIERFDATGGLGRHLMSTVQYAQAAGLKLATLDQYFSRVAGENIFDAYLLKVENASARPLAGFKFLATVCLRGLGATEYQTVSITGRPTRGNFRLTFSGQTTSNIAFNASPATLKVALENLASIGVGNVECVGSTLPTGVIDIIFQGALAGAVQPPITAQNVDLNNGALPKAVKVDFAPERILSVIVTGDPTRSTLAKAEDTGLITIGSFAREFGIPYVASVTIKNLPSEERTTAHELSLVLQNKVTGGGDAAYSNNTRRKAAESLALLGSFAWDELQKIRDVADDTSIDAVVRNAASEAHRAIKAFKLDAAATVLVSTGDVLEPLAMARASIGVSAFVALTPRIAPPANRLPISVERGSSLLASDHSSGIRVRPVNDADLSTEDLPIVSSIGTLAVADFQGALDEARKLAKRLRDVHLPATFHGDNPQHTIYDLVREIMSPTLEDIRESLNIYRQLTPQFEARFRTYAQSNTQDPALSHLLGIQILDATAATVKAIIAISITDIATGNVVNGDPVELLLSSPDGEALLPIPLRFVDSGRKGVKITVTTPASTEVLLTHFSGLLGNFSIVDQKIGDSIDFEVARLIERA